MANRRPVALVTRLDDGEQRLVHPGEPAPDELAPAIEEALRRDRSVTVTANGTQYFIAAFNPPLRLVVVGAVHVAQHLVPMARALGFDVTIVDPRTGFASEERFAGVALVHAWPDEALPAIGLDHRTAVVALTHDPKIDDPALRHALTSPAFYVGALGSRRTHAKRVERLSAAGLSAAALDRLHAPIGLDIGAEGPAEIALSIAGEVVAVLRGKGEGRR